MVQWKKFYTDIRKNKFKSIRINHLLTSFLNKMSIYTISKEISDLVFYLSLFFFTFFVFLIYFFIFFILYNIVLVLTYINMNLPRVYMCSQSLTPLPPPSPYHPSGSSQCTSPKLPVSCIEPGRVIHFLYDIIMICFNAILPNHTHAPLPQSPKDCSIHLCLFCCLAYRVIVTIFLNSICMR